ncbi:hypothetical protein ACOMHN_005400 [Nucella lapillus]
MLYNTITAQQGRHGDRHPSRCAFDPSTVSGNLPLISLAPKGISSCYFTGRVFERGGERATDSQSAQTGPGLVPIAHASTRPASTGSLH